LIPRPDSIDAPLIELRGICKAFQTRNLFTRGHRVVAAEDVNFSVKHGEIVALVGESGSGKSTIAKLMLRLNSPDRGEIRLDGVDVLTTERKHASLNYRRRVQMIFQDPFGSLNRVHTIAYHIIRPLLRHGRCQDANARTKAIELLQRVGLEPAEDFIDRHPYQLSGGQRQRVAIARALGVEPDLLVADEPTSMLDVSIRMGILQLLKQQKEENGLSIILITHDLASARYLADRVLVLFRGRVVEEGTPDEIVNTPLHPYTQALVASIAGNANLRAPAQAATDVSQDTDSGCPFAARCSEVRDICRHTEPPPYAVEGRQVRCHLYVHQNQHSEN
jgi:peptide/nickel transport system ATP-binding protein